MSNDNIEHDLDLEDPTGDFNIDCMLNLIAILKNSCTEHQEVTVGESHEHSMFDNVDMEELDTLENIIRDKHKTGDGDGDGDTQG